MPEAERKFTGWLLIVLLLYIFTGCINTMLAKWADTLHALGRPFIHPYIQTDTMFLGEWICMIAFFVWAKRSIFRFICKNVGGKNDKLNISFNPLIFFVPSLFDLIASALNFTGLTMTNASSYQMLRGSVIFFTGFLSVTFLHRKVIAYRWIGIFIVIIGLVVVGISDFIAGSSEEESDTNAIISGDLLVVIAQMVQAAQMVYEEKFVVAYDVPPLYAVGLEGMFGFLTVTLLCIVFYFIHIEPPFATGTENRLEDAFDAFNQMHENNLLIVSIVGTLISIPIYNALGITVTKYMSATTRMVSDNVRTVVVWVVTLLIGWQAFAYIQLIGFIILVFGMCIYNDIVFRPMWEKFKKYRAEKSGQTVEAEKAIEPPVTKIKEPANAPGNVPASVDIMELKIEKLPENIDR